MSIWIWGNAWEKLIRFVEYSGGYRAQTWPRIGTSRKSQVQKVVTQKMCVAFTHFLFHCKIWKYEFKPKDPTLKIAG